MSTSTIKPVVEKRQRTVKEMARELRDKRANMPFRKPVSKTRRFFDRNWLLITLLILCGGYFIGMPVMLTMATNDGEARVESLQSQVVEQAGAEGYYVRWGQDDIGAYPNANFGNVTLVKDSATTKGIITIDDKDVATLYQADDNGNLIKLDN